MKSKLATAIALVGLMHSSVLYALGMGDIKVSSAVNERLNAEIPLVHADGLDASQILVSLASKADFARAEIERDYFLS
ncbi:MAG: peptigoglycan-binding protein LysM, partial [Pseudomonadales bacterium]|nr:peptigoglycan-binding protein LysM [Pseudomonadales bacterium]